MRLYLALREAAHQRLYGHVGWLRQRVIDTIEAYARGIRVDPSAIERAMSEIDPTNPESLQNALTGGMFEPDDTPEQVAALRRLETLLALVEGWVDAVVQDAAGERMPGRRRAARGVAAPAGHRRAGRADLLDPGRAGAAAAPAARGGRAVVGRHRAARRQRPRRDLGAPRPAARPPRTSTTRSASPSRRPTTDDPLERARSAEPRLARSPRAERSAVVEPGSIGSCAAALMPSR